MNSNNPTATPTASKTTTVPPFPECYLCIEYWPPHDKGWTEAGAHADLFTTEAEAVKSGERSMRIGTCLAYRVMRLPGDGAMRPSLTGELAALYEKLANIHNQWPGRNTTHGQCLLAHLRGMIAQATGQTDQAVQDSVPCTPIASSLSRSFAPARWVKVPATQEGRDDELYRSPTGSYQSRPPEGWCDECEATPCECGGDKFDEAAGIMEGNGR